MGSDGRFKGVTPTKDGYCILVLALTQGTVIKQPFQPACLHTMLWFLPSDDFPGFQPDRLRETRYSRHEHGTSLNGE